MLRVGMSGTGGVGKTTVLNAIMDKYPHLQKPISSPRYVFAKAGITEADQINMSEEAKFELQEQIAAHMLQQFDEIKGDSVWDRTMLDRYAYGMVRNHSMITQAWLDKYIVYIEDNLASLSHFFFFPQPTTWEPRPDGLRDPSPGTRKLVDLTMKGYLLNRNIRVNYVPTDAYPEEVVDYVLGIIASNY